MVDVSVVTTRREDWVVPTAEEAAALIDEAAKATGADAGKPRHHKDIEISRVLRKMTRARILAPEIAAREEAKHKKYENFVVPGQYSAGTMMPFVVSAGEGVSREAREMITMINTEVARDEKTEALRINGAFSIILLRYATKMEEAV